MMSDVVYISENGLVTSPALFIKAFIVQKGKVHDLGTITFGAYDRVVRLYSLQKEWKNYKTGIKLRINTDFDSCLCHEYACNIILELEDDDKIITYPFLEKLGAKLGKLIRACISEK